MSRKSESDTWWPVPATQRLETWGALPTHPALDILKVRTALAAIVAILLTLHGTSPVHTCVQCTAVSVQRREGQEESSGLV